MCYIPLSVDISDDGDKQSAAAAVATLPPITFLTSPPGGAQSIVISVFVCLSVCLFARTTPNFTDFIAHVA